MEMCIGKCKGNATETIAIETALTHLNCNQNIEVPNSGLIQQKSANGLQLGASDTPFSADIVYREKPLCGVLDKRVVVNMCNAQCNTRFACFASRENARNSPAIAHICTLLNRFGAISPGCCWLPVDFN